MEYYLQPNDWMIVGVGLLLVIAIAAYVYYVMMDREESPVSKEELGYVLLSSLFTAVCTGGLVYGMILLRLQTMYPPVDGVDMGEPPF